METRKAGSSEAELKRPRARSIRALIGGDGGEAVQTTRSTIFFLISAIAFAGFNPLGQVLVQFMIVWQR